LNEREIDLHELAERYYREGGIETTIYLGVHEGERLKIPFIGLELSGIEPGEVELLFGDLKRRVSLSQPEEMKVELLDSGEGYELRIEFGSLILFSDGKVSTYPYFLASGSLKREGVEVFLRYYRLCGFFAIVAFKDGKPEPRLFLTISRNLKISKNH
jgi:hypothetical protein